MFQGLGYYRLDSILSVLDKGILIVILGYMLYLPFEGFDILHFAYAQTVALGLTALTAVAILMRKRAFHGKRGEAERVSSILRQAAPFALAVFLMTIYTRIDGVMIEQLAENGAYQSGAYAAGYRLLDAANMVAYLFAVLLLPMFTRSLDNLPMIRSLLSQGSRVMLVLTITVAACCVAYRAEVMELLYSESTVAWGDIFGLLIASFIAVGGMYIFGTYLTARGELRRLNIIYLCCVGLNVILNFILIPSKGATGAAIATLATQSAATIILVVLTVRATSLNADLKSLLNGAVFVISCIGIAFVSQYATGISWILRFVVSAMLMGVLALITGLIRPAELREMIRR